MKNILHKLHHFYKKNDGGMLILGAAAIATLLTVTTGTIDTIRYINMSNKFTDAADTALLAAAAVSSSQDVEGVTRRFLKANLPPGYEDSIIISNVDITTDPATMAWTAEVSGKVKTLFGGIVGASEVDISHTVTVSWDIAKKLEVVFMLDTSASMCMDVSRSAKEDGTYKMSYVPDYTCKKLNAMKEAMSYVIDNGIMPIQGIDGPAFYAGIIPFNHKVRLPNLENIPSELTDIEKNHAKGDPKYYEHFEDAEPLSEVIPLHGLNSNEDKQKMKDLVNKITQSPTGRGWTRSNIATLTAALMLDPQKYSTFGGALPHNFDKNAVNKVVVMMTDGANVGCCFAAHDEGNFDNQYLYLNKADNAHLMGLKEYPDMEPWAQEYNIPEKGLCDQMKEQGITIYSVIYDVDENDPGGKAIKDAYEGCATSNQFFFDVKDKEDLQKAYKTISQSFLNLRISY
ncbi:MAG: Flp pilus assembly protein TadG [Alphaproteobacteria bacterium]|jgi:Flp pilus assembly protein TadG